ncbi:MAG TPA: hypothetical protein VGN34_12845 [Ktedonobacteraceae bacterium]|jgi:hypothetical protein
MDNEPDIDAHDTPTERATISQLTVDELDFMLQAIRTRRLDRVQKLEAIAKVKADETRLELFLRYEKLVKAAKTALTKAKEQEDKADAAIHKLRIAVMAIMLEVSEDA